MNLYGKWYGTQIFYTDQNAISLFKDRIAHVFAHVNPDNGKTWAQSSEYIFAFETHNESMHENLCHTFTYRDNIANASQRSTQMRSPYGSVLWLRQSRTAYKTTQIFLSLSSASYLATSMQDVYFSCSALDVIAIHVYSVGDFDTLELKTFVDKTNNASKKLIMQEWGACYNDNPNNDCHGGSPIDSSLVHTATTFAPGRHRFVLPAFRGSTGRFSPTQTLITIGTTR